MQILGDLQWVNDLKLSISHVVVHKSRWQLPWMCEVAARNFHQATYLRQDLNSLLSHFAYPEKSMEHGRWWCPPCLPWHWPNSLPSPAPFVCFLRTALVQYFLDAPKSKNDASQNMSASQFDPLSSVWHRAVALDNVPPFRTGMHHGLRWKLFPRYEEHYPVSLIHAISRGRFCNNLSLDPH